MISHFSNFIFIFIAFTFTISNSKNILDYSHKEGSTLDLNAGKLSSFMGVLPFSYNKLGICGSKYLKRAEDTLGEILTGEKVYVTGYRAYTNENRYCKVLCSNIFTPENFRAIKRLIRKRYYVNWYLDRLPAGLINYDPLTKEAETNYYSKIPLGYIKDNKYYIYNHLQFHISLNKIDEENYNIVGFSILPISIKQSTNEKCVNDEKLLPNNFYNEEQELTNSSILFTYDTIFELSDVTFGTRWDNYKPTKRSIHWAGIIISNIIVVIITVLICVFLLRTVKEEVRDHNFRVVELQDAESYANNWKSLGGDVFRPPRVSPLLLSTLIGTGIQLFLMVSIVLLLGVFGFLNPEYRNKVLNLFILFFCLMGLPGGFVSSKFYKYFGGISWVKNSMLNAFLFPAIMITGYLIVNILLVLEDSNAAVEVTDLLSLLVLWIFCTFPLILIGSFFGAKSNTLQAPFEINAIPSIIPEKPWYLHYKFLSLITGFISFVCVGIELFFALRALWRHEIYFLVTFLYISFTIFIVVTCELSILVVFMNLTRGDYNWWWRSFLVGASPAIYFFLYSVYYFFSLRISRFSAIVVYYGFMGIIACMIIFICGSLSTIVTFSFLKKVYKSVRAD